MTRCLGGSRAERSRCRYTMPSLTKVTKAVWMNQLWLITGSMIAAVLGLWWQYAGSPISSRVCLSGSALIFGSALLQAWREENARLQAEQARNARPELAGEIIAGLFRSPHHVPPDGETGDAHVLLKVSITNSRPAPTRIRNWKLWLDLDGIVHKGRGPLFIPDKTVFYAKDPIPGLVNDEVANTEYPTARLDELALHQAVHPNAPLAGWLWFSVKGVAAESLRDSATFVLEALDEHGSAHVIRRNNGLMWSDAFGVLDSAYPGDAYNLRWMNGNKPSGFR